MRGASRTEPIYPDGAVDPASSLDFDVVYFVTVPDYNAYMDIQQHINLELFRRFEAEGVEFAYPTQTVFVVQGTSAEAPSLP